MRNLLLGVIADCRYAKLLPACIAITAYGPDQDHRWPDASLLIAGSLQLDPSDMLLFDLIRLADLHLLQSKF